MCEDAQDQQKELRQPVKLSRGNQTSRSMARDPSREPLQRRSTGTGGFGNAFATSSATVVCARAEHSVLRRVLTVDRSHTRCSRL